LNTRAALPCRLFRRANGEKGAPVVFASSITRTEQDEDGQAMMGRQRRDQGRPFYEFRLEDRILGEPSTAPNQRVRHDLHKGLESFYSDIGRPSVDPQLMIRMLVVGHCYGIWSERRLIQEVELHLACRDNLHTHGFVSLFHVLHALRRVALLHRGLGHIESRRRLLLLGGVGHLGDHVIHLLHMGVVAEILGIGRADGHDGQKRYYQGCF